MNDYKKCINFFETFATNHQNINDFYFGDIIKFHSSDKKMPVLLIAPSNITVNENINLIEFYIGVFDFLKEDYSNLIDIYDDTYMILNDLIIYLRNYNNSDLNIKIGDDVTLEPTLDKFDFQVAGFSTLLKIELQNSYKYCDIPLKNQI